MNEPRSGPFQTVVTVYDVICENDSLDASSLKRSVFAGSIMFHHVALIPILNNHQWELPYLIDEVCFVSSQFI